MLFVSASFLSSRLGLVGIVGQQDDERLELLVLVLLDFRVDLLDEVGQVGIELMSEDRDDGVPAVTAAVAELRPGGRSGRVLHEKRGGRFARLQARLHLVRTHARSARNHSHPDDGRGGQSRRQSEMPSHHVLHLCQSNRTHALENVPGVAASAHGRPIHPAEPSTSQRFSAVLILPPDQRFTGKAFTPRSAIRWL